MAAHFRLEKCRAREEIIVVELVRFFLWQLTAGLTSRKLGWAHLELRLAKVM
jgi:hypothetical protein